MHACSFSRWDPNALPNRLTEVMTAWAQDAPTDEASQVSTVPHETPSASSLLKNSPSVRNRGLKPMGPLSGGRNGYHLIPGVAVTVRPPIKLPPPFTKNAVLSPSSTTRSGGGRSADGDDDVALTSISASLSAAASSSSSSSSSSLDPSPSPVPIVSSGKGERPQRKSRGKIWNEDMVLENAEQLNVGPGWKSGR